MTSVKLSQQEFWPCYENRLIERDSNGMVPQNLCVQKVLNPDAILEHIEVAIFLQSGHLKAMTICELWMESYLLPGLRSVTETPLAAVDFCMGPEILVDCVVEVG